jgi:hypothetical protein
MIASPAIRHMIRDKKTHSILSAIQTGSQLGMRTLDASLFELYSKGSIEKDDMLRLAERPDEILEKLGENVPDYMRTSGDGAQRSQYGPQNGPPQGQQQPGQQPGQQRGYGQPPYGPQQGKR